MFSGNWSAHNSEGILPALLNPQGTMSEWRIDPNACFFDHPPDKTVNQSSVCVMPVQLPDLLAARLFRVKVCLAVEDVDSVPDPLYLRSGSGERAQFVRVYLHGEDTKFLHVEMATPEFFRDKLPKRKGQKRTLDKIVSELSGTSAAASVSGDFSFDDSSAAAIVGRVGVTSQTSDVSLKLTGANFAVSGTPYGSLRWNLWGNGGETVDVYIAGTRKLTISDTYLLDAVEFLQEGIQLFGIRRIA